MGNIYVYIHRFKLNRPLREGNTCYKRQWGGGEREYERKREGQKDRSKMPAPEAGWKGWVRGKRVSGRVRNC